MPILGIETSCDETGIAIYDGEQGLLAHKIYSQAQDHARFGGWSLNSLLEIMSAKLFPSLKKYYTKRNWAYGNLPELLTLQDPD